MKIFLKGTEKKERDFRKLGGCYNSRYRQRTKDEITDKKTKEAN